MRSMAAWLAALASSPSKARTVIESTSRMMPSSTEKTRSERHTLRQPTETVPKACSDTAPPHPTGVMVGSTFLFGGACSEALPCPAGAVTRAAARTTWLLQLNKTEAMAAMASTKAGDILKPDELRCACFAFGLTDNMLLPPKPIDGAHILNAFSRVSPSTEQKTPSGSRRVRKDSGDSGLLVGYYGVSRTQSRRGQVAGRAGGKRHHDAGLLPAFSQCPGQRLQPEKQSRAGDKLRRRDSAAGATQ